MTWLRHFVWSSDCYDGAKEATAAVITLQTWMLGQMVALFIFISQHPKPSPPMNKLFLALAAFPVASLVSIVWAFKTMKISTKPVHYFDQNSIWLARCSIIGILLLIGYTSWQYASGQLPGQSKPVSLEIKSAKVHEYEFGSAQLKIPPKVKGLVVTIPVSREVASGLLEFDIGIDQKKLPKWVVTGAKGYKIEAGNRVEEKEFPPEVLVTGDSPTTIYWHQLNSDFNYELAIYIYGPADPATLKDMATKVLTDGSVTVTVFVPQK